VREKGSSIIIYNFFVCLRRSYRGSFFVLLKLVSEKMVNGLLISDLYLKNVPDDNLGVTFFIGHK